MENYAGVRVPEHDKHGTVSPLVEKHHASSFAPFVYSVHELRGFLRARLAMRVCGILSVRP